MSDKVCSKCNVDWVIHAHDKHCGYCGCKVFDFSVKWKEEPLLYIGNAVDFHDLTILVENSGAYPITFLPITTTRQNTIQFTQANNTSFEVNAGKTHSIPIQVNPSDLAAYHETITVRVENLEGEKSLKLQALPCPEFNLTPSRLVVSYRKGTDKKTENLRIQVLQGKFFIDDINFSQGAICRVGYFKKLHKKDNVIKNVCLEIDCNKLNENINMVKLRFKLRGISEPIQKEVQIQREIVPEPPRLFVPKINLEVTQEREKKSTLTLQNTGEETLTIQNIVFNDPSNLVQLQNVAYPIEISGGEYQNVDLLISADGVKPKNYHIDFTINSNCKTTPQYQDDLIVKVRQQEEYPHYLAIDFGTTNSCCAYYDSSANKVKLIPPEIMPSSIVYHSNPQNGKTYHVGYEAENYRTSEIDAPYYISSVKRWLGYNWERQFPNNLTLQPRDVVTDIIKHIIEQAEAYLDTFTTKSKITKCVVTYPTMFPHEQREDFKHAFEKIENIDTSKLILIDEASAASIGTIFQGPGKTPKDDYRLLVYDFGGGTIDIVLSHVTRDGNKIKIEPLSYSGNQKFGGDDVTQTIVEYILDELKQQIQAENPDLRFDIPYFKQRKILQSSQNPKIDKAASDNTNRLYLEAERMKKELSEKPETVGTFTGMECVVGNGLSLIETLTQGKIDIKISEQQLKSRIEAELKKTFAYIDGMIKDNSTHLPDTVVLAGQSSKMPLVKEMMSSHFKEKYSRDIEIHLDEHPKTCVVMGAARYGLTENLPGLDIQINFQNKTHSRYGIAMMSEEGRVLFNEIVPKGKLIPNESFGTSDIPINRTTNIEVYEHLGSNNEFDEASLIGIYTLDMSQDVPEAALQEASLKMAVEKNGDIEVNVIVDGVEYNSTFQRTEPAFVNEI